MNKTTPPSILDGSAPARGWDFNEKLFAALALLVIGLPALLAALVVLLMIVTGGPR